MISRYYVRCIVCQAHHTLRVQIGYGSEQRHRFHCHHCNEPIEFVLPLGQTGAKPSVTGAEFCGLAEEEGQATNYQYLSSDFVADAQAARDPLYFGSMELMDSMLKDPRIRAGLADGHLPNLGKNSWFALSHAARDWSNLQRCWRLERSGKQHLATTRLAAFAGEKCTSAWQVALDFTQRMFGHDDALMNEVVTLHSKHAEEFSRLVVAYSYAWQQELREGQFQVFNEFFKRWDTFSQVYLYVRNSIKMPKVPAATSLDFDAMRDFYSHAQEYFAKQVRLLTALNNIKSGRPFDRLQQITLEKYFSTDNAKRRDNFSGNTVLANATQEYDSGLRNAEAHGWIVLEPAGNALIYKQGGTGQEVRVAYVDYLVKCTALFKQICHLMQVEYLLVEAARVEAIRIMRVPHSI